MKQKIYFMLAAAAALFTACSSNDLSESPTTAPQLDDSAVNFGAYVNRGTTRAGAFGTLTTTGENSEVSLQAEGFGVFAYYSDSESYSETSKPNFMYNQKVAGENWSYSPLKYWPNEFGKNAASEGQDRLTFFAYAPFVEVNPSTGRVVKDAQNPETTTATSGIVGITSNTASGDPYVKYYVDMDPDKRVDLCWGVAKDNFNESVDEEYAINAISAGEPYIDVIKPKTGALINFDFKHALASVNVQIDTDIDTEGHSENSAQVDAFTRIWVRSVTFEGFTDKGRLNLNSRATEGEGPQWFDLTNDSPVASGVVSVYDGRTDGKEGRENATAKKETPATLNAKIIQSAPYSQAALNPEDPTTAALTISDDVPGVTKTAVNLFDAIAPETPVYVIPTDENLKVTIVYDVETYDPNLAQFLSDGAVRGSSVQNTIEKEIVFQNGDENVTKLEAGKKYTINLHLGLTSVKFDASVTEWAEGYGTGVDLPYNTADGHYTEAGAAAHNATLPGAKHEGDEYDPVQYYTPEEIAAHNATLDIWDANTIKEAPVYAFNSYVTGNPASTWGSGTVKVVSVDATNNKTTVEVLTNSNYADQVGKKYIVHATNLTGGASFVLYDEDDVATAISVDVFKVYSFESFDPVSGDSHGTGMVKVISQEGGYTTVEVIENNPIDANAPDFVGMQFKVEATDLENVNTLELLTLTNDATGISVKNLASVIIEDHYTAEEIAAHNTAIGAWDAETHRTYTQEEADEYNSHLDGAVKAGDPIQ